MPTFRTMPMRIQPQQKTFKPPQPSFFINKQNRETFRLTSANVLHNADTPNRTSELAPLFPERVSLTHLKKIIKKLLEQSLSFASVEVTRFSEVFLKTIPLCHPNSLKAN